MLGIETSEIFGCGGSEGQPRCDRDQIVRGLDEIEDMGVASFFPIHKFDNAFGGVRFDGGTSGAESFIEEWRQLRADSDPRFKFGVGFGADANGFHAQPSARGADKPSPVAYPFRSLGGRVVFGRQVSPAGRDWSERLSVRRGGLMRIRLAPVAPA